MKLRKAKPTDIGVIMKIERSAFIPAVCETETTFAERIAVFPDGFLLLEDDGGTVCGYFASERWRNVRMERAFFELGHSAAASHEPDGSVLYVSSMGILPSHRGTGLGTYLFNTACRTICDFCGRGDPEKGAVSAIALLVNETWKSARRIYTQAGFTETARFAGFFPAPDGGSPSDGIVMERAV